MPVPSSHVHTTSHPNLSIPPPKSQLLNLLMLTWGVLVPWLTHDVETPQITYTVVIVSVNQTANNLSSYLPPGFVETLTPDEIQNAIYGSKFVFICECFKLTTIWLVKACLLILYSHMTWVLPFNSIWRVSGIYSMYWILTKHTDPIHSNRSGLPKQHRSVKWVACYCALGYVVVVVLFLSAWCRPIEQYWAVPPSNCKLYCPFVNLSFLVLCNHSRPMMSWLLAFFWNSAVCIYYHHLITDAVFNISSDLMMLFLPLPLLIKAKLPLRRKFILSGVFSLGVFVVWIIPCQPQLMHPTYRASIDPISRSEPLVQLYCWIW